MNDYLAVLKKYAVFIGRAGRKEFWMFVLVNIIVMVAISIIESVLGLTRNGSGVLSGLYSLAVLIPSLAVGVRRLHDTGRSGWYLLIGLIPLIGAIVLIVFYATDGQPGANKYGPNPKEAAPPAAKPAAPTRPAAPSA